MLYKETKHANYTQFSVLSNLQLVIYWFITFESIQAHRNVESVTQQTLLLPRFNHL